MLEVYAFLNSDKEAIRDFHVKMAQQLYDAGNQYWLVMRTVFNHMLMIFAKKPFLMASGFSDFLVNFSICREKRSLDSEIHLYRMETLIPQAVPKKYENLGLEEISYQGAYIRCMALIITEGIIKNTLTSINCLNPEEAATNQSIHLTLTSLEQCICRLFELNKDLDKNAQHAMPYSEEHRQKLRVWQSLLVFLQLLDPTIYTLAFREVRKQHSGIDIVDKLNTELWLAVQTYAIPSVRQYIDVFSVRFCVAFPTISLSSESFQKTMLDPNMRGQVSSSYLLIAGFSMVYLNPLVEGTGQPNDTERTRIQKVVFEAMLGFCNSNTVHARCISQWYTTKMFEDPIFRAFIPQGCEIAYNYMS